ncbi:MAG: uncharacterized protein QOH56_1012 [Pseudonocardiales bacterium]|nr:uncharacterized protein [Pseudonocardiales bacterium]MDQ1734761.1 uncharacterized protein [Pseudonocardiales bacterium]
MATETEVEIVENTTATRFEIHLGGVLAGFTVYRVRSPELYSFVHTEISPDFEHRGLASQLIQAALDSMRSRGISVLPYCPFVRAFIAKHPDYVELVPADQRGPFDLP